MARSIEAGKAFLKLLIDDSEFSKGLDKSLRHLDNFGRSLQGIGLKAGLVGAAITAPFVAAIKTFADVGSELKDMAGRTGLTVERLQELKYAAEQSGTGLEAIVAAARHMQQAGVDPNRFAAIAKSIAAIKDPTARATAAFDAFGSRAGQKLLPVLDELSELIVRFRSQGLGLGAEDVNKADALGDAMHDVALAVKAVGNAVASDMAPQITDLASKIAGSTPQILAWVHAHKDAALAIAELGAAITVLAPILGGLGSTISGVASGFQILRQLPVLLNPVVLALAAAGSAITAFVLIWKDLNDIKPPTALVDSIATVRKEIDAMVESQKRLAAAPPAANSLDALAGQMEAAALERKKAQLQKLLSQQAPPPLLTPEMEKRPNLNFAPITLKQGGREAPTTLLMFSVLDRILRAAVLNGPGGKGLPGFRAPGVQPGVDIGARSTFSGRLSGQVLAGGTGVPQKLDKIIDVEKRAEEGIRNIDRKLQSGAILKYGIA